MEHTPEGVWFGEQKETWIEMECERQVAESELHAVLQSKSDHWAVMFEYCLCRL